MSRLIDADEVKKRFPIMENDFGMVINERLHKHLDEIPTVEAISKATYEARLKDDMVAMLTKLKKKMKEEIWKTSSLHYDELENAEHWNNGINSCVDIIQEKIKALKENKDGN